MQYTSNRRSGANHIQSMFSGFSICYRTQWSSNVSATTRLNYVSSFGQKLPLLSEPVPIISRKTGSACETSIEIDICTLRKWILVLMACYRLIRYITCSTKCLNRICTYTIDRRLQDRQNLRPMKSSCHRTGNLRSNPRSNECYSLKLSIGMILFGLTKTQSKYVLSNFFSNASNGTGIVPAFSITNWRTTHGER